MTQENQPKISSNIPMIHSAIAGRIAVIEAPTTVKGKNGDTSLLKIKLVVSEQAEYGDSYVPMETWVDVTFWGKMADTLTQKGVFHEGVKGKFLTILDPAPKFNVWKHKETNQLMTGLSVSVSQYGHAIIGEPLFYLIGDKSSNNNNTPTTSVPLVPKDLQGVKETDEPDF